MFFYIKNNREEGICFNISMQFLNIFDKMTIITPDIYRERKGYHRYCFTAI